MSVSAPLRTLAAPHQAAISSLAVRASLICVAIHTRQIERLSFDLRVKRVSDYDLAYCQVGIETGAFNVGFTGWTGLSRNNAV
jgi:hypothetical protein